MQRAPLGKLTPPHLGRIYRRQRLFRTLDQAKSRPVAWVAAPAGSGKTTLVASYLQARKLPSFWYQLDAGDEDTAGLFYHLRLAAGQFDPTLSETLPLLAPEYRSGIETFSRNFFHRLFAALPRPLVLVFDNYQDTRADALARGSAGGSFTPLLRIIALTHESHLRWFGGNVEVALAQLEQARALATESGVHVLDSLLAAQFVYVHAYAGEFEKAEGHLAAMAAVDTPRRLDRSHYHFLASWVAWLRGDAEAAWQHALAAEGVRELHAPFPELVVQVVLAQLLRDRGDPLGAQRYLARANALVAAMGNKLVGFFCLCTEAWFALLDDEPPRALDPLRRAFAWGAASGTLSIPGGGPT